MSTSTERIPISKGVRFNIFNRDGFTCKYCGKQPPQVILVIDHVIAVASGGTNDPGNLVTSCQECNQGKSAKPIGGIPESSRLSIIQEQMESVQSAEIANSAVMAREETRRQILQFIFKNTDTDSFDKGYLTTLVKISNEFGIPFVFECIDAAYRRLDTACGYRQKNFIMYICGIVRRHRESLAAGGPGVKL